MTTTVPLSAAQQAQAETLLDSLLDLPEGDRLAALERVAPDDAAVRSEVETLLHAAGACGTFLAVPAQPAGSVPLPAASPFAAGDRLGPWRIVGPIGRGGMGEVYEAERADGGFAQRVAIKLLRPEASEQLERFHAERQILARLEHPGIASLHDGGLAPDGRPWMAMELVFGRTLTAYCAETRATLDQRLQLVMQVCDAVAYAHHHLVVHRDLKPANILVNDAGQVKLLDFGIAKLLDGAGDAQTLTRSAPLTPLYAAPEQLTGGPITTATDVYALGILMFELLTGGPPWSDADTPVAQLMRAVHAQPAPLASLAASARAVAKPTGAAPVAPRLLHGDLDAIVAKALRAEPSHRYATVDALRRDIDHARRGEAVAAREGARLYAAGRLLRRYRWAAAATSAVFVALAIGLGVAAWQAHRAATERDIALRDAAREEALRYQLTGLFRSAIADHGASAPTAKSMLDQSAQRVLKEYRGQPLLAGQVVLTLADLYDALEDVQGSATLLEGFLAEAGADADPFAVADARQKLAAIELMRGHVERAGKLLDQADAYWSRELQPHAAEHLEGQGVRARWQRASGDLDAAIATDRATIAQRTALSGHDHRETATLLNSLAITLTAANRLDEALAAYKETSAIYDKLGLGEGLDAQIIRGNTGTLALRAGHLDEAGPLLKGAIDHERALAGDSAAVGASKGYYGKWQSIVGKQAEAIATLASAVDVGTRYTGATSPLTIQNRLFLGEAQGASGDRVAAKATLDAALRDAAAHYGEKHALTLRSRLALAQLASTDGMPGDAVAMLAPVVATLRGLGAPARATLAQALVVQGEAELADHRPAPAVATLREATSLRMSGGEQNWELAQARERLGEALAASGSAAEALPLLKAAASVLTTQLGAEHREARRARRALSGVSP